MVKEGLTEEQAFDRLRRASQKSGRPMKVIAGRGHGHAELTPRQPPGARFRGDRATLAAVT